MRLLKYRSVREALVVVVVALIVCSPMWGMLGFPAYLTTVAGLFSVLLVLWGAFEVLDRVIDWVIYGKGDN